VARDELRVHGAGHLLEVALASLGEQQREEVDLEEQVAQLVDELRGVVALRRVGDLVGLFDRVRDDRPRRLLAVPGAIAAQPLGQLLQLDQRSGEAALAWRYSLSGRDGRSEARTQGASIAVAIDATEDAVSGRAARSDDTITPRQGRLTRAQPVVVVCVADAGGA
jgi:hypothetical protein